MIAFILLVSMLQTQTSEVKSDTTYVSTIGSRFYLKPEAHCEEFALYSICDTASAIKVIQYLKSSTATGNLKYQMMLNLLLRQLTMRNYSKEQCLVLMSPRTRSGMLGQPFRIGSDQTLIYTFLDEKADTDDFSSVRILVWPKANGKVSIVVRGSSGDLKPKEFSDAP